MTNSDPRLHSCTAVRARSGPSSLPNMGQSKPHESPLHAHTALSWEDACALWEQLRARIWFFSGYVRDVGVKAVSEMSVTYLPPSGGSEALVAYLPPPLRGSKRLLVTYLPPPCAFGQHKNILCEGQKSFTSTRSDGCFQPCPRCLILCRPQNTSA